MNAVNYQITVNLVRVLKGEAVRSEFAIEHSGNTINEIVKKAESLCGEELTPYDSITIRKSYR